MCVFMCIEERQDLCVFYVYRKDTVCVCVCVRARARVCVYP